MLDTHGKDLLVQGGASQAGVVANTTTASSISAPGPGPSATAAAAAPSPKVPANKSAHTAVVRASATFMAAADDLFSLLTDAARIPMWTRAPATSAPEKGGAYTLFGGGVRGTYVELDRPKRFVQTWALQNPSWPSGAPLLGRACWRRLMAYRARGDTHDDARSVVRLDDGQLGARGRADRDGGRDHAQHRGLLVCACA
jgi:activator of HSP90 ATPase